MAAEYIGGMVEFFLSKTRLSTLSAADTENKSAL